jgi:hypothetical protein
MFYAEYRKQGSRSWWLLGRTRTKSGALAKIRAHRKRFGFGGMFRDDYRVTTEEGTVVA